MNADVLSNCIEQAIPIVREAGKLILEEAGGTMTDFHGTAPFLYGDRSDIIALNGHIHADLRFLI